MLGAKWEEARDLKTNSDCTQTRFRFPGSVFALLEESTAHFGTLPYKRFTFTASKVVACYFRPWILVGCIIDCLPTSVTGQETLESPRYGRLDKCPPALERRSNQALDLSQRHRRHLNKPFPSTLLSTTAFQPAKHHTFEKRSSPIRTHLRQLHLEFRGCIGRAYLPKGACDFGLLNSPILPCLGSPSFGADYQT